MIEKRICAKDLIKLLGVSYRKALNLLKTEIPSLIATVTSGKKGITREYRYTYQSFIEDYQRKQREKVLKKAKNEKRFFHRSLGLDPRPINEFLNNT
jgi:hypothetical protein